ncbi:hypothetical protein CTI12_AA197950 [Artemisia annua]|uniref:Uncharacterized protein n=1 Tax=Artemisia annua TaxID=35608 RepID=A0A2U1M8Z3_ARTAN|nr:hypothetical protein CTI12_AA197950 [Artemisia annua]
MGESSWTAEQRNPMGMDGRAVRMNMENQRKTGLVLGMKMAWNKEMKMELMKMTVTLMSLCERKKQSLKTFEFKSLEGRCRPYNGLNKS